MAVRKKSLRPVFSISNPEIYLTTSADETREIGAVFSRRLKAGDIVFLSGELGSGKTTFVQGIARGFGIKRFVRSSSFMLVNEYDTRPLKLYHMDLYRIEGCQLDGLGLEEYLCGEGVCLIEWAEKIEKMDVPHYDVRISWQGENERKIEIRYKGKEKQSTSERNRVGQKRQKKKR
jgi:tRNA threonylcarbamoyladenosine biosynthesis protein TsaE